MNRNTGHIVILIVCIAIIAASFAFTLNDVGLYFFGFKWRLHCILKHTFGIKCAFCGMTRSFTAITEGDIAAAFGYHRLGPLVFFFIALQIPYRIRAISMKGTGERLRRIHAGLAAFVLTVIFVNWLIYMGGHLL